VEEAGVGVGVVDCIGRQAGEEAEVHETDTGQRAAFLRNTEKTRSDSEAIFLDCLHNDLTVRCKPQSQRQLCPSLSLSKLSQGSLLSSNTPSGRTAQLHPKQSKPFCRPYDPDHLFRTPLMSPSDCRPMTTRTRSRRQRNMLRICRAES